MIMNGSLGLKAFNTEAQDTEKAGSFFSSFQFNQPYNSYIEIHILYLNKFIQKHFFSVPECL